MKEVKTTFEKWGEKRPVDVVHDGLSVYVDWKAEREKLIGSLEKLSVWGRVAFYPGPNEDPSFQAGYMTAIHDAERQINRKLAEAKEKL